jgi:hypothetical protein
LDFPDALRLAGLLSVFGVFDGSVIPFALIVCAALRQHSSDFRSESHATRQKVGFVKYLRLLDLTKDVCSQIDVYIVHL